VQLGTAFLGCPEADTHPAHRQALADPTATAITRAFSGRRARGVRNRFMAAHGAEAPSAYPQVHYATAPLRTAARKSGDAGGFNLWAGQTHRLALERPAADVVRSLGEGAREALRAAAERLAA
jgi:nitronate monooxygenase